LASGKKYAFRQEQVVDSLYRPYTKLSLYFSKELNEMQNLMWRFFYGGNSAILFSGPNSPKPFTCLATNLVPDFNSLSPAADGCRVMPLHSYHASGERVENITDWALEQFHQHYQDKTITKENIFHYVYAVLHHPAYRSKYEQNLKREFPHIPFYADFRPWAEWGRRLMDLHLNYEQAEQYSLAREDKEMATPGARLIAQKETGVIEVDTATTLGGVPAEAWQYRLGTYSALEWILERHKERKPKDPTIREKFSTYRFADYKEQVIDLLRRVCTVSVETMKIIRQMPPDVE
jgi:predicted helicase